MQHWRHQLPSLAEFKFAGPGASPSHHWQSEVTGSRSESTSSYSKHVASGFLPPTMSYVTYNVVRRKVRHRTSDVRCRTCDIQISDVRHRTCDVVRHVDIVRHCTTSYYRRTTSCQHIAYDIVRQVKRTISYAVTCSTYDVVCTYRIRYRTYLP